MTLSICRANMSVNRDGFEAVEYLRVLLHVRRLFCRLLSVRRTSVSYLAARSVATSQL